VRDMVAQTGADLAGVGIQRSIDDAVATTVTQLVTAVRRVAVRCRIVTQTATVSDHDDTVRRVSRRLPGTTRRYEQPG
jgi:hypothetical protein